MRYSSGFADAGSHTSPRGAPLGPVARIDLGRLTAKAPLHRPSVAGTAARTGGSHIAGAIHPPAAGTVDLSDGTRISFAALDEVPVLEYA